MNLLRLETLTMINLLGFGHLLVLILLLAYQSHRVRPGPLNFFMVARLLQGIGWILIPYRGVLPNPLTIHAANILLLYGAALEGIAFSTYREKGVYKEHRYVAIATIGSLLFVVLARAPSHYLVISSVTAFFIDSLLSFSLLRRRRETALLRIVGTVFGVVAVSLAVRAFFGLYDTLDISVSNNIVQTFFFLSAFAALLVGGTAIVLLLKQEEDRALNESLKKYDTLFSSTPMTVLMYDPDTGIIHEVNPQCFELTGFSDREVIGTTLTELGLWDSAEHDRASKAWRRQGRLVAHEIRARNRNGEPRTWMISAGPVVLGDRRLVAAFVQDITERKALETRIQTLLEEKEVLLQEIHHRVRNNFSQVISYLTLQAGTSVVPDASEILMSSARRIESMLALYDHVYREASYAQVRILDFLQLLTDRLSDAFSNGGTIRVLLEIEEIDMDTRTASTIGQLLTELYTNSMKHAFRDRTEGTIRVSLKRDGAELVLEYEDDGPGLPDPDAHPPDHASGFGSLLIAALVKQLHGTLELHGPPGVGYRLMFAVEGITEVAG